MKNKTAAVNRRPLYALYAANVVSNSGNVMAFIAIPWFVLQTTGSASQTGITAIFTALPAIVAAFFGGVIIDRIGYKRTSVMADLASGAAMILIPMLYLTIGLLFPVLLSIVFLGNLLDAPGSTARQALSPDLAQMAGLSLERMSAFNDAISRSTRLIGASLAGFLIALIGPSNVLWIDALTFFVSAIIIGFWVPRPGAKPIAEAPSRFFAELREGIRYIRNDRLLLAIIYTVMITNLLDGAIGSVMIPIFVQRTYNNVAVVGLISGLTAGTALLSALYLGITGIRGSRRLILTVAFIIVSLRAFLFALSPSLPILFLLLAVLGLAIGVLNPILGAVELERILPTMRARAFGVISAGVMLGTPIGGASGLLVDRFGLTATLCFIGLCYLLTTASLIINPAMRDLDNRIPSEPSQLTGPEPADK